MSTDFNVQKQDKANLWPMRELEAESKAIRM
jgi:hypothetical protein